MSNLTDTINAKDLMRQRDTSVKFPINSGKESRFGENFIPIKHMTSENNTNGEKKIV